MSAPGKRPRGALGRVLSLLPFLLLTAVRTSPAAVILPDLQQVLADSPPGATISVIATFSDRINPRSVRGQGKSQRRSRLIRALKGKAAASHHRLLGWAGRRRPKRLRQLWMINGLAVTATPAAIRELAAVPGVSSVRLDSLVTLPEVVAGPAAAAVPEWNLEAIRAPELWALGHTGAGVVVATMDTGVDVNHPDLSGRWRGGLNSWFDPTEEHAAPFDAHGHGTQTMGLIVGGDAGGTAIGTAPAAQWVAVKMFNDAGEATLSRIHEGFQWLLDPDGNPDTNDAPDVVNNSWELLGTTNHCLSEFASDMALLREAGIAVVFSAGNQGPGSFTSVSPANEPGSFATGAVDGTLTVASFSSRGPSACDGSVYPRVVAPGVDVRTAGLTFGGTLPGSYASVTGTSFAAPHAAGAMAVLLSAFPHVSVSDVELAVEASALDLGSSGADDESGHGLIDVMAAYEFLLAIPPCTDLDGDGYAIEGGTCGPPDCNDDDPTVNPGTCGDIDPVGEILADVKTEAKDSGANFGGDPELSADADSEKNIFIKVNVTGTGGSVTSAVLRLTVRDARRADSVSGGRIQRISDCGWDEYAVTFNDQPKLDGVPGPDVGPVKRGATVMFDVTEYVTGDGMYCFGITSDVADGVDYLSREADAGRPELLVTTDCGCDGTSTTTSTSTTTTTSTTSTTTTTTAPPTTTTTTTTSTTTSPSTTATSTTTTSTTTSTAPPTTTTSTTTTSTTTTTLPAGEVVTAVAADVRTEAKNADTNFGADVQLSADADSEKNAFIKVSVSGAGDSVAGAFLRLTVRDVRRAQSVSGGRIQRISDCGWDEYAVTFNNQPTLDGVPGPDVGPVERGTTVTFDVSHDVGGDGTYCFAITSDASDGVDYNSREAATGQPELIVRVAP